MSRRAQTDHLFHLQVQGDKYARLVVDQKHQLRQLEDQWKKLHTELQDLRVQRGEKDQRGGGVNAVRTRVADEQREVTKLENRLATSKTRESQLVVYNNELRARVNELRANRVASQLMFEDDQRRLRELQKQMHDVFRLSTQIVAERDRVLALIHSLSGQNVDEQEAFDQVYTNLAAIIKREKEGAEAYRKKILQPDAIDLVDDFVRGNMTLEDEQQLKKNLQKLELKALEDKRMIASVNDKLEEFESTFRALQEQMGVDDYHQLVDMYATKEENHFALFRYIQSTSDEVERLEEEKMAMKKEIQKLKSSMQESNVNGRKRMIDKLVETREKLLTEQAQAERLYTAATREFQPFVHIVTRMYTALGCHDVMPMPSCDQVVSVKDKQAVMVRISSMNDLFAASGITVGNILQFLAIIEERSHQLIMEFSRRLRQLQLVQAPRASIMGVQLHPSDPAVRSLSAVRTLLPHCLDKRGLGRVHVSKVTSPIQSGSNKDSTSMETTEEPESPKSDVEDDDRPLTIAELQKRAAKSFANAQTSPKLSPLRSKPAFPKKKLQ